MNKRGATNLLIWILIALAVGYFLYSSGYLRLGQQPQPPAGQPQVVPSDLQTTVNFKFKDELATTETNVPANWICFNGDGTYFDSGTAGTDGTDSMTAMVNSNYDCYAYVSNSSGWLAKKFTVTTGNKPQTSVTMNLVKRSSLQLSDVDDPVDLNDNITAATGTTDTFRVKWKANASNAASHLPVIVIETNSSGTGVEDVTVAGTDNKGVGYKEIDCPDRLSVTYSGNKLYCFQREEDVYSTDGLILTEFSIKIDDSTDPGDSSWINVTLIDTGIYLKPDYTDISGVLFGQEDDNDNDVASADELAERTDMVYFND